MMPFNAMRLRKASAPAPGGPATWDPSAKGPNIALTSGNLLATKNTNDIFSSVLSTTSKTTGKWYAEILVGGSATSPYQVFGVATSAATLTDAFIRTTAGWGYYQQTGEKYTNNVATAFGASFVNGSVIGIALDADAGLVWFSKDGVWQGSGNPATGASPAFSGLAGPMFLAAALRSSTFGVPDSALLKAASGSLSYSPPTGFTAWG